MQPLLVHMIQPGHFWSYPSFESTLTDISPVCIQRMNLTVFAAGSLDAWNNFPPLCYSLARLHNEQPLLPVLHMSTGSCLCGPGWKSTGIDQQTRLMCCDKENIFWMVQMVGLNSPSPQSVVDTIRGSCVKTPSPAHHSRQDLPGLRLLSYLPYLSTSISPSGSLPALYCTVQQPLFAAETKPLSSLHWLELLSSCIVHPLPSRSLTSPLFFSFSGLYKLSHHYAPLLFRFMPCSFHLSCLSLCAPRQSCYFCPSPSSFSLFLFFFFFNSVSSLIGSRLLTRTD